MTLIQMATRSFGMQLKGFVQKGRMCKFINSWQTRNKLCKDCTHGESG